MRKIREVLRLTYEAKLSRRQIRDSLGVPFKLALLLVGEQESRSQPSSLTLISFVPAARAHLVAGWLAAGRAGRARAGPDHLGAAAITAARPPRLRPA